MVQKKTKNMDQTHSVYQIDYYSKPRVAKKNDSNIQFDIQFVETLKNQGTNYPTAACEGFALVTAVFLW